MFLKDVFRGYESMLDDRIHRLFRVRFDCDERIGKSMVDSEPMDGARHIGIHQLVADGPTQRSSGEGDAHGREVGGAATRSMRTSRPWVTLVV
jgi:hypothetical protein